MNQFTYWPFSGLDCFLINAFSVANRFDAIANAFAMKWSLDRFFFSLAYVYNFYFFFSQCSQLAVRHFVNQFATLFTHNQIQYIVRKPLICVCTTALKCHSNTSSAPRCRLSSLLCYQMHKCLRVYVCVCVSVFICARPYCHAHFMCLCGCLCMRESVCVRLYYVFTVYIAIEFVVNL